MIWRIEEIRAELEARLFAGGNPEVLLHGKIEIVDTWIPNRREVTRRVAKRLQGVEWPRWSQQPRRRAIPREIERVLVKPVIDRLIETRGKRIGQHHWTIGGRVRRIAVSVAVVQDPERRTAADR